MTESNYADKEGMCRAPHNSKQMCLNDDSLLGAQQVGGSVGLTSPMGQNAATAENPTMEIQGDASISRENCARRNG